MLSQPDKHDRRLEGVGGVKDSDEKMGGTGL